MTKGRYAIMRRYMSTVGDLGLDMMTRTPTVQVNLDFSDEADMVLLRENPLEDIQRVRDIRGVVAAGHWYSTEDLAAMVAGVRDSWPPD